jgi:CHASE2 domain-containing sensor protein
VLVWISRLGSIIVLAMLGTYLLSLSGALHGIENWLLKIELSLGPRAESSIKIVMISDVGYQNLFGGKSPLNQNKLHDLIDAIARSNPKVIAVDIDTSDPSFHAFKVEPSWRKKVVWERDISAASQDQERQMQPLDILGGQDQKDRISGIPVLLDDPEDKVTRYYTQCVETKFAREPVPSFVTAVTAAFLDKIAQLTSICAQPNATKPILIRYSLDESALLAARVIELSDKKSGKEPAIPSLEHQLVLLGGDYLYSDRHFTPLGVKPKPGVLILANAIQTELDAEQYNNRLYAVPKWGLLLTEFVVAAICGVVIVTVFHRIKISLTKMIIFGILFWLPLAFAVAAMLSLVFFRNWSRLPSFAPTLIAVLLFEIYEHVRHESILRAITPGKREQ